MQKIEKKQRKSVFFEEKMQKIAKKCRKIENN
jgi:hypothetical protein